LAALRALDCDHFRYHSRGVPRTPLSLKWLAGHNPSLHRRLFPPAKTTKWKRPTQKSAKANPRKYSTLPPVPPTHSFRRRCIQFPSVRPIASASGEQRGAAQRRPPGRAIPHPKNAGAPHRGRGPQAAARAPPKHRRAINCVCVRVCVSVCAGQSRDNRCADSWQRSRPPAQRPYLSLALALSLARVSV